MKKILVLIAAIICTGLYANAQSASGSCQLPGSNEYVNVDYYDDGHLAVSNQSGMKITQLRISVLCTVKYKGENGEEETKSEFLCNKTFYDIPANKTTRLTDGVKSRNDIQREISGRISRFHYEVKVENPMCKKQ